MFDAMDTTEVSAILLTRTLHPHRRARDKETSGLVSFYKLGTWVAFSHPWSCPHPSPHTLGHVLTAPLTLTPLPFPKFVHLNHHHHQPTVCPLNLFVSPLAAHPAVCPLPVLSVSNIYKLVSSFPRAQQSVCSRLCWLHGVCGLRGWWNATKQEILKWSKQSECAPLCARNIDWVGVSTLSAISHWSIHLDLGTTYNTHFRLMDPGEGGRTSYSRIFLRNSWTCQQNIIYKRTYIDTHMERVLRVLRYTCSVLM